MRSVAEMIGGTDAAEIEIEPMRRRHLTRVISIEQQCYPKPWTRGIFESEISQMHPASRWYLVARQRRRVIGYGGVWITGVPGSADCEAHITNIAVDPEWRRRGVGEMLMCHLAEHVIAVGCRAWTLEVRADSEGAQAMYRRFGFAPAGVRRGYYENGTDAIVMWCHDIHTAEYAAQIASLGGPR